MNGVNALRRLFGLHPMNEAPAADAPAPAAAPAPATDAPAPTAEPTSLLGAESEAPKAEGEQPAAEPETDGDKPADDAEKDDDKPDGAPEEYADFVLPEGVELDEDVLPDVKALFKELGLPQELAQSTLEKLLAIQEKMLPTPEQQHEQMTQNIARLNADLAAQTKALPEIGGENFPASLAAASKVMMSFASPELRELLNYTAVGSHPEFFKFIHAIGTKMAPDVFVHGGESAKTSQRPADIMFGDLFKT